MKLSKILQSLSILPDGDQDGRDSWGIFMSPEHPNKVIKLFYDEQQFNDEKTGYDKVLGESDLLRFANKYSVISVELDTSNYSNNRITPPYENTILIPYLPSPPWELVGKLGTQEADDKLVRIGINVEKLKDNFCRIGIASWEATFFEHPILHDIKAIDFTYSDVVFNSNADIE
ncbi:MAG: hypothetical protein QM500_21840 [Methylococcales bacterium]